MGFFQNLTTSKLQPKALKKKAFSEFLAWLGFQKPSLSIPDPEDALSYQDLLHRPQTRLEQEPLSAYFQGKNILITGAGGSIGSEIALQVLFLGAAQITLVENSEIALYSVEQRLNREKTSTQIIPSLCDITRLDRFQKIVRRDQPDIIFHAAALKHVPMVERNPSEGILNNVFGTRNIISAANQYGVKQLVLISSDKAVAPSSVMGATKRLAEYLIRHECVRGQGQTSACVVRFGNVLGSTGSVVPLFRSQIERGGPITLTDPNVERFFMTIFEAVQLVLRAAVESHSSTHDLPNLYVLEMGRPIRIVDLAKRLIKLYGLKPGKDIEIKYIGLRDGEKLTEDLIDIDEAQTPILPGIHEISSPNNQRIINETDLQALYDIAMRSDDDLSRSVLFSYVNRIHRAALNRQESPSIDHDSPLTPSRNYQPYK